MHCKLIVFTGLHVLHLLLLLLQEPWDHLLRSWAKLFSSCSPVLHQLTMSSIHSLHGLPLLFVPSTIPNVSVFNFLLSSILHMWQTIGVSSEWLFVADPLQFWVCHIFHGLFFAMSNWYVGSFGNSTSQMPAVCLWSFCCMSRFHTHIALCWMLLYVFFVSLVMFLLFQIFSMDFVTSVALPIFDHKSC